MLRKIMGLVVGVMVISAAVASADVPSLTLSTAATAAAGPVKLTIYPNCTGTPFTSAYAQGGTSGVDATVTLVLVDAAGNPIADFPWEDLWIDSTDAGDNFNLCQNGGTADANTDATGNTTWTNSLCGGGYTDPATDVAKVYVNGAPLAGAGMAIQFNSPDNTGDLLVNLQDVQNFASDLTSATVNYRSDFNWDNLVNLVDVQVFANGLLTAGTCPQ